MLPKPKSRGFVDREGQQFGWWTVIAYAGSKDGALWLCRCKCGTEKVLRAANLRDTSSCGCRQREAASKTAKTPGRRRKQTRDKCHGMSSSYEYHLWNSMIQKCRNPNSNNYVGFGGRGISVCQKWQDSFSAFIADVGKRPSPDYKLERLDDGDDFEPGNVEWRLSIKAQPDSELKCSACGQMKPIDEFRRRADRKERGKRGGRWSKCKDCEREASQQPHRRTLANQAARRCMRKLKAENPAEYARRLREQNLQRKYGIGIADYDKMLADQNGVCAICGEPPAVGKNLHVDHDHATGKVRGLLCGRCNPAIGNMRDERSRLHKAAEYLARNGKS
jgi:hypothetical protein